MKTKSRNLIVVFLMALAMLFSVFAITPLKAKAESNVRVDFCLTNGALENNVFFENDSSKYFMSQQTKADGTLTALEELYRTDNLDLEFDGWYTDKGEKVTLETVFTEYTILYDRWKETTLTDEDIISTLEIGTPLLEVGETAGTYDVNGIVLTDNRLSVEGVSVYEGLNAYRTNQLDDSDVLEVGKSYSIRVELHTKSGELIDDQLMNHSTATYGLVANMVYSHDNSGIFTTQWTNRENKIQVIINYDFENYYFTSDLEDKVVENGQSPQYTVYVNNNANVQGMELFVKNANDTWASLGAVTGQFNIPANGNVVKQYRVEVTYQNGFVISSNTFSVDWYDPDAPKFITQPTDYDVAYGTNVLVTWGLNCSVSAIYLEKFNGETYSQYQNATPTGATVNAFAESGTYTFRVHATKDGGDIYSEKFTITWREKFVFTTQPQSQSVGAGLGEDIIITWDMDIGDISLLQIFKIETYDTSEGWRHSVGLTSDTKSYTFYASNFAYAQKYRLMANYDGVLYYSDEFTIEFIAGEFTSKPESTINAIIGNDCLVEWDFTLDVEYYDIKVGYATVGEEITLDDCTFTPPPGMKFKAWAIGSVNGEQKQPSEKITITEETYIYAIWEVIPHECVGVIESGQGATCTVDGWNDYYLCECGKYYEDANCQTPISDLEAWKVGAGKITAAHSGTPEWTNTATTHAKKYTCCDTFVVETEAHEWNNGTCSECGYVCLHTSVAVTKKDGQGATCTVDGWKDYYQCACGKYFADEARTTPISDLETWKANDGKILAKHEYGNLIPEESAVHTQTELKAGMHAHYYCSACETYFDENKVETTENALIIPAPQHSYGDWVKDNEKHWKVCSCGLKSSENTHQYDDNSDMICNDCGWDRTVQHTHGNGTKQDGQGATCTVNGWKDYYKCSCGKLYTEAACTNEITSFEEWKNGDGKIEAGHSYGDLIEQVSATCSATGKEAHYCCSVCGTFFNANQEVKTENELTIAIDANAHTYGAWTSNGDGTHTRVCSLNGEHKETADCSGGTATCTEKAICAHCNTAYGDTAQHNHGTTWESDANNHWNECTCGDKANKASHTDSNNDGKCDTCEYQMSTTPDNPNNTPDNPNNTPDDPTDDKDGLGAGAIIGIVSGSVAVVGVGGFALFWFVIKKKTWAEFLAIFKKK